jgi:copper(I)-binding protein
MCPVTTLPLEPGKPLTLTPGGYQIMLLGLEPPLKQGQSFPLIVQPPLSGPCKMLVQYGSLRLI